jgi:hypothetical protein
MLSILLRRYFLSSALLLTIANAQADTWKVLFYMDSTEDLNDMAFKNITDMMRGRPNDSVEFLIQLHAYFNVGLRYQVTDQGLIFIEEVPLSSSGKQDLIHAASWAFSDNDADHTMLILSDHGWGILDPKFNPENDKWEIEFDQISESCAASCSTVKRSASMLEHKRNHKGFMFNNKTKAYLNNQDLITSLDVITNDILLGQPLDILTFDTCMGAMLEVAHQVAPFAHYLVGSQSCSLLDGFDYQGIIPVLNQDNNTPRNVATGMVRVFDAYYGLHDSSGIYTHTAIELERIAPVRRALDTVVSLVLSLPDCEFMLDHVRDLSPRFCLWPMYTDVVTFFKLVDAEVSLLDDSDTAIAIHDAVEDLEDAMHRMVIARCGGSETVDVTHGCAIYCPFTHIDSSYYETLFADDSLWIMLLEKICGDDTIII